jgi:hypothetical protein
MFLTTSLAAFSSSFPIASDKSPTLKSPGGAANFAQVDLDRQCPSQDPDQPAFFNQ